MSEALFEILRGFRLDAEPVSCEPYGCGHINARFDQCQDAARVVCFCAQEFRDGRDVLHQTGHVAERVMIDLLQNIAAAAGRRRRLRHVPAASGGIPGRKAP